MPILVLMLFLFGTQEAVPPPPMWYPYPQSEEETFDESDKYNINPKDGETGFESMSP